MQGMSRTETPKPLSPEELAAKALAERVDPRTGAPVEIVPQPPGEIGGPKGPEPTRYGDWDVNGRCSDF
ncbi:succinate dehydrogenase assembly factor 4 [Inquilinus sp.]|uniref:DUF1674 domain-containing protein n=1 Tax=Inquilinus sp. TaxID=1932117 RepID=UPI0031DFE232